MSPWLSVTFQVLASIALLAGVLLFMWRMPGRGDAFLPIAPYLSFASPWLGILSLIGSIILWFSAAPDLWLTLLFLALDPAAIASGVLIHWVYRAGRGSDLLPPPPIPLHKLQANVGISLGLISVALGYIYVLTHKTPLTPVGI